MNEFNRCPTEGAIGLLALLINSGRLAEARLDDALATVGLTFVKWRALDLLAKADAPVALKRLPDALGCVKSNVTQLVDKLETESIVQRLPDPDDRRGTLITLTSIGSDAHQQGRQALEGTMQALFVSFSYEQREALRGFLKQLNAPGVA